MTLAALLTLLLAGPGWAMLPDEPPPPEPKPAPKAAPKPHPKPQPKPRPKPQPKPEPESAAPSNQRFTDNRNGTVTDRRTGLIWLKDANCFDKQDWSTAMASAGNLSSGICGLRDGSVAGQWRLPSKEEWQALIDKTAANPALPAGHPFTGVQSSGYWSATKDGNGVWYVGLNLGNVAPLFYTLVSQILHVWPVRDGR